MKKNLLIMMLAFVACFVGAKANELTVADGTATNALVPCYGAYFDVDNTIGQMIYPASELAEMSGAQISKVSFYSSAVPAKDAGAILQISMGEVDDATFASNTLFTDLTVLGTHTVVEGETGFTFEFDTPFTYSGDKNIVIEVALITKSSNYSSFDYYGVEQTENTSMAKYGYGNGSFYPQKFMPKVTFEYTGELKENFAKVTPENLNFGKILVGEDSTLNVTIKNLGANTFTPSLSGLAAPFSTEYTPAPLATGEIAVVPIKYAPTAEGSYNGTLVVNCGEAGSFNIALTAMAKEPGSDVTVCDETDTSDRAPVYGLYHDTPDCQVQFIYPAEKLTALKGRKITSMKFFANSTVKISSGKIQLSLKETEQTGFDRESAISKPNEVTNMTVVATVVPVASNTELEFVFNEPFLYNGGNLAVETRVIETGSWASTSFRGENRADTVAFYAYTNTSGSLTSAFIQFLPKAQFESIAGGEPVVEHTYNVAGYPAALFGGSEWATDNEATAMTLDPTATTALYTWTSEETELPAGTVVKFKVAQDKTWDVAYPENDVVKTAEKHGKYTLTVTFDPETKEVVGTLTMVEEIVEFDKVYILGNVNNNVWATNVGVEMETQDGKVYTKHVDVTVPPTSSGAPVLKVDETEGQQYGWFSFSTKLMETADDWSGLAPYRFGAVSDGDFRVYKNQFGQDLSLTAENGKSFQLEVGSYDLEVDKENMTLVITGETTTGIENLNMDNVKSVRYYNLQGVESATPFDGVNIMVREMTDGSKVATKVVK